MTTRSIAAVFGAIILFFAFPLRAQGPEGGPPGGQGGGPPSSGSPGGMAPRFMMGGMGGESSVAMTVANGAVFLVSQGKIYKFDDKRLTQLAVASLIPTPPARTGKDGAQGKDVSKPPAEGAGGPGSGGMGPGGGSGPGGMGPGGGPSSGGMPGGMMGRMRSSGGAAIQVVGDSVYVFHQNKLFRLSESKLEILATATVESRPSSDRPPPPPSSGKPAE